MYFRIEKSTPIDFISTSDDVLHMELDRYRQGFIVYTDANALMTHNIHRFAQLSGKRVVVADTYNYCMRLVDRTLNSSL